MNWFLVIISSSIWFWKAAAKHSQKRLLWLFIGVIAVAVPTYLLAKLFTSITVLKYHMDTPSKLWPNESQFILVIAFVCGIVTHKILVHRVERKKI